MCGKPFLLCRGRHVGDPLELWMSSLANWLGESHISSSGLATCEPLQLKIGEIRTATNYEPPAPPGMYTGDAYMV